MNAKKNKMSDAPAAAEQQATETEQVNETTAAPATEQGPAADTPGSAENPLPPEALPPVEAELIDEAAAEAELDISDEDRQAIWDAAAKVFEEGGEPQAKPAPIDGPVALLGKTQGDAAATAHAAGTVAEAVKTEPAPAVVRTFDFPPDFKPADHGYTVAQVLDAAIAAHQANKAYCESIGDMSQKDWEQAADWQCNSAIDGVCFAIANNFPSPDLMHENWCDKKLVDGWKWGPVKDAEKKEHPCLTGYPSLPEAQRLKHDHFREAIMSALKIRDVPPKPAEPAEKGPPTEEAKAMASMLACAFGMTGTYDQEMDSHDVLPAIAMCLADYFQHEPDAPAAGGLMQLKLKLKVILLPNEDPRRVELALDLFRQTVSSMLKFADADAKAEADRQLAEHPLQSAKPGDGEGTFERDDERLTKSDIGKALDQRAV